MEIPFDISETVWWTGYGYREEWIVCPECNGQKALTLIQGNGDTVSIACANCSQGCEPPLGRIKRAFYHFEPQRFICEKVEMHGYEFWYHDGERNVSSENLFKTREECEKRCIELNVKKEKEEESKILTNITRNRAKIAWSVHYWGRTVSKLTKELDFAKKRLSECKERKGRKT